MKKKLCVLGLLFITCFSLIGCGAEKESDESSSESKWREGGLWDVLPKPDTEDWEMGVETDTYLSMDVKGSEEDYTNYVNKCREAGFEVDLYNSDKYYSASNADGYFVDTYFYEDDNKYSISIDDRRDQGEEETAKSEKTTTEDSGEAVEDSTASGEVTPAFKEAMDSYEQFFQEYVDFMETYNNSDDPTSLMGEYNDYMKQYTDTMAKLDDIDEDSLSEADKQYYVEVSTRISAMLTDSLGDML